MHDSPHQRGSTRRRVAPRTARIGHLAVLCRALPNHRQSSGELRFWQILRHLRRRARKLTVFAETDVNRDLFPELPVQPMAALRTEDAGDIDLAFLEFWFMDRHAAPLRRRGIPIVLDSVDIEFLRRDREKALHGLDDGFYRLEKEREIRAYRAADQVWAVSAEDAQWIRDLNADIVTVPNIFDPVPRVPGFERRRGVCFVGSYSHQPNVDGLRWYRDAIYPQLRDVPHTIIGSGAPDDLRAIPGFVGGVPSSVAYVRRSLVSIAPLRYGAGLKGKVLEALACGTPVVTTRIGDEGYSASRSGGAVVADDPDRFAFAVRALLTDEQAWTSASACARAFAGRYAPAAVAPVIDDALAAVLARGASQR